MDLTTKTCKPCEGGVAPLSRAAAHDLLRQIPGWNLADDDRQIMRLFTFKSFCETMAFVNAVAYIASREDHHPDLVVRYSQCEVRYSTHAIGGLSENDFICAAKIDGL
ncbi:MAG: 4a-hydroxytetrahydrobiopterin dehydratase [Acidiferrobacter sp.]